MSLIDMWRPEVKLLLLCARVVPTHAVRAAIGTLVSRPLDWDVVMQLALRHKLVPLLYHSLAPVADRVPPDFLEALAEQARAILQRNLLLTRELLRLLALLEEHAVPAAPFKGPMLASCVYGNLALRTFNDLDIIIHRSDVWRARDVLIANGYKLATDDAPAATAAYISSHNDLPFLHCEGHAAVEVQWAVMQEPFRFPANMDRWWTRFEIVPLAGRKVQQMAPEDLLLILSVHGCKHLWERLSWVCDIAELICTHPQLDWQQTVDRARAQGAQRMLRIAMLLAHRLLNAPLPEEMRCWAAADHTAESLMHQVCAIMFRPLNSPSSVTDNAPIFYLRMRERKRDQARILRHLVPNLRRFWQVARKYRLQLLKPLIGR